MKKYLILTEYPKMRMIYGFDEIFARSYILKKLNINIM